MPNVNNFFDLNIKILNISGLWIPTNEKYTKKKYLRLTFNVFCVFYSMVFFNIAELISLNETSKNLNDLIKNLNMSMSFLLTTCKVFVWFYHRKSILLIMSVLVKNIYLFEEIKGFNPKSVVKKGMGIKNKFTMVFFILACAVPISSCLSSFYTILFDYNKKYLYIVDKKNITSVSYNQKLPYYSWVPFEYTSSRITFGVAVIYQCLGLLSCGIITVGFDTLYASLVSFLSDHFKILQGAFCTIRQRCTSKFKYKFSNDQLDREMYIELNKCIGWLQVLFKLCDEIEAIFTYLILMQVLISLVVFCTCLYLVSSVPVNKILTELTYLLAIETQLALYCYAGNKVTFQADNISSAIYKGDWFQAAKSFKSSMLITMTRMKKPVILTIGKFSPLTLTTFVTIGRGSYSLLAVIKKTNLGN